MCIGLRTLATELVPLIGAAQRAELELIQTLNRIVARFQNRHPASGPDKLARFAVNPLVFDLKDDSVLAEESLELELALDPLPPDPVAAGGAASEIGNSP